MGKISLMVILTISSISVCNGIAPTTLAPKDCSSNLIHNLKISKGAYIMNKKVKKLNINVHISIKAVVRIIKRLPNFIVILISFILIL